MKAGSEKRLKKYPLKSLRYRFMTAIIFLPQLASMLFSTRQEEENPKPLKGSNSLHT